MADHVTVDGVLALHPCEAYTDARLRALFGDGLTLADAVTHPEADALDRLWLATQWVATHDRHMLVGWLDLIVERALRLHCVSHSVAEVRWWARAWLDGDEDAWIPRAARNAAAAVWSAGHMDGPAYAAAYAAQSAAYAGICGAHVAAYATYDAAGSAAYAAYDAAYDAAYAASYGQNDALWHAELEWQLATLAEM